MADVSDDARAMHVEPFGPLALVTRFGSLDEGLKVANRLPYGLAAYAFTRSTATAAMVGDRLQAGGIGINSFTISQIKASKDSGHGNEGLHEGLQAFMHPKYVHHVT